MSAQSRSAEARTRQQQSSHMLKTGRRGNPFCKDTHDLFATLMVSLDLSDRTRFFRTYPDAFTTDDAAANLASLRFSQSNRTTDPNDPQRIVTTTTTTTFSMSRDIAKGICQHFMDARLIENATDPTSLNFKDRGIYQITPKGLHILERFITKNGISADHLIPVFTTQPICMKLLHLERRQSDDEIHISRSVIEVVFRRFAGGRHPNYVSDQHEGRSGSITRPFLENVKYPDGFDRGNGCELQDVTEKTKAGGVVVTKQVFSSTGAVDWLLDYATCCCREEAGELMAHMVRYNLVVLYADRSRTGDRVTISEVVGTTGQAAEYRHGPRVLYRISEEGQRIAMGHGEGLSTRSVDGKVSSDVGGGGGGRDSASLAGRDDDAKSALSSIEQPTNAHSTNPTPLADGAAVSNIEGSIVGRKGMADLFKSGLNDNSASTAWNKDQHSTTTRLRAILDDPQLRSLFRDFLRANYCDENLGFWIEVSDFRRRFSTTSSAVGASTKRKQGTTASNAMETHQQNLVAAALHIYNNYLAPLSPNELNIDHNLRADVVNYVNRCLAEVGAKSSGSTDLEAQEAVPPLRATQVQTLLRQYERIQEHIFRLLATDQVPRFIRTEPFLTLMEPESLAAAASTTSLASTNTAPSPVNLPSASSTPPPPSASKTANNSSTTS
ncbi:GTPase-activating protein SST2 [Sporobolomyces salmoneus]|uniref:GTPase-activating protein SST2 n=1 Tax=Sporobolomyces salmoneus TaxID=183962 RepID=UPI00316D71A9